MTLQLIAPHEEWKIETPAKTFSGNNIELRELREVYTEQYGVESPHYNFIGIHRNSGEAECVISVMKNSSNSIENVSRILSRFYLGPSYKALLIDADGYEEFTISGYPPPNRQSIDEDRLHFFTDYFNSRSLKKELLLYQPVTRKTFIRDMIAFENQFTRRIKHMKIAVLYVQPQQKDISQIFHNQPEKNTTFWKFMNQLACPINVETWTKYRGDMGTTGDDINKESYFTDWNAPNGRDIEIMFHLAPNLNSEQHRRLIGNDIGVIIFFDNTNPHDQLNLFGANDMGIMPHVFSVVEPHPTHPDLYRLAFFNRGNVVEYKPPCPPTHFYFNPTDMKNFLLTKLCNGMYAAQHSAPLNRLFTVPRRAALQDLAMDQLKCINKKGPLTRVIPKESNILSGFLRVILLSGKNLIPCDSNRLSDPYCVIQIGENKWKTRYIRKTLNPKWDEEYYYFPLMNIDPEVDSLSLVCMDWNPISVHRYMGEYHILLKHAINLPQPISLTLSSSTVQPVTGEIQIHISLVNSQRGYEKPPPLPNFTTRSQQATTHSVTSPTNTVTIPTPEKNLQIPTTDLSVSSSARIALANRQAITKKKALIGAENFLIESISEKETPRKISQVESPRMKESRANGYQDEPSPTEESPKISSSIPSKKERKSSGACQYHHVRFNIKLEDSKNVVIPSSVGTKANIETDTRPLTGRTESRRSPSPLRRTHSAEWNKVSEKLIDTSTSSSQKKL